MKILEKVKRREVQLKNNGYMSAHQSQYNSRLYPDQSDLQSDLQSAGESPNNTEDGRIG